MSRRTLGRDDLVALRDLPVELLDVPEWPDYDVYVRGLDGHGRAAYFAAIMEIDAEGNSKTRTFSVLESNSILAFHGLCDPEGNRLLTTPEDMQALGGKSALAIERVARAVQRLSGLGSEATKAAMGNSEPTPSDEPSSD